MLPRNYPEDPHFSQLKTPKKMLNKYLLPDSMTLATITHNSSLLNNRMFLISLKIE